MVQAAEPVFRSDQLYPRCIMNAGFDKRLTLVAFLLGVIAIGVCHSVRELVEIAFGRVGLNWQTYVRVDPGLIRPAEVDHLLGDSSKARKALGWNPQVDFRQLIEMMVDADLQRLSSTSTMARMPSAG